MNRPKINIGDKVALLVYYNEVWPENGKDKSKLAH